MSLQTNAQDRACLPTFPGEEVVTKTLIAIASLEPDADPTDVAATLRAVAHRLDPRTSPIDASHLLDLYQAANRLSALLVSGFKLKDVERYLVQLETAIDTAEDVLLAAGVKFD